MSNNIQTATFGGGCFWCVEAVVQQLAGVQKVISGYSGGANDDANYHSVASGKSNHAEVVQVFFDSDILNYSDLIEVFLSSHDPTQLNGQGADIGRQYRSVIFYHNEEQHQVAQAVINSLKPLFKQPIVTELTALDAFYPAEIYHQDYYKNNSNTAYCSIVINPKLQKLRKQHSEKLKA